MEPTTLVAIGVGLYFLLSGGKSGNGNGKGKGGGDTCPPGYTKNAAGQCVKPGGGIDCAPGLVRDADGKCMKAVVCKPGQKCDGKNISKIKPDKIGREDAWIGPDCTEMVYGPDFFRGAMVPAVLEYVDAGYGFAPEFYTQGEGADSGALASIGTTAVIAGMLGTYSPRCADLLNSWTADNVPSQATIDAFTSAYDTARADFMADKITQSEFNAVKESDPVIAYFRARDQFIDTLPGAGARVRELAQAIRALIADRGMQNMLPNDFSGPGNGAYTYPARFTPTAEDFAA